jgi:phage/plasmid-associated DNA primase
MSTNATTGEKNISEKTQKMYQFYGIHNYSSYECHGFDCVNPECTHGKIERYITIKKALEYLQDPECCMNIKIESEHTYKLFGDVDKCPLELSDVVKLIYDFCVNEAKIKLKSEKQISMTKNTGYKKEGNSYHYVIPQIKCRVNDNLIFVKYLIENIKKKHPKYNPDKWFDTSIYNCGIKGHFFRLPNQYKGKTDKHDMEQTVHEIQQGKMKDFILSYIPKSVEDYKSKWIEPITYTKIIHKNKLLRDYDENHKASYKLTLLSMLFKKSATFKLLFDNCYKHERFNDYETWIRVGKCLYNELNEKECFETYKYFSQKGDIVASDEELLIKIKSFEKNNNFSASTIHWYAKEDNRDEYKKIISTNELQLTETDIITYVDILRPGDFMWVNNEHYMYNGKYYVHDKFCSELNIYIGHKLYSLLSEIIGTYYFNSPSLKDILKGLKKLKTKKFQSDCDGIGLSLLRKDIKFDTNPHILSFNNTVYDLKLGQFREFVREDYITVTTGYDWIEPTNDDILFIQSIIDQILFKKDIQTCVLQILSSGMNGLLVQKFVIFHGNGGNAKSWFNGMMKFALGNFAYKGNNSVLLGNKETNANPAIANMDRKRYIYYQEFDSRGKLNNATIKELTGDNIVNARLCYSNKSEISMCGTQVCEFNELPDLVSNVSRGEFRRFINIPFESEFTENMQRINHDKHIYQANSFYVTDEFRSKYKYAFVKILMEHYVKYQSNGYVFDIPEVIKKETAEYLQCSDDICEYLEPFIEKTDAKENKINIKTLYDMCPEVFKKKCTQRLFNEKIKKNPFFGDYYVSIDKNKHIVSHITHHKMKTDDVTKFIV